MKTEFCYRLSSKIVQALVNPVLRFLGGELTPNHKATSLESSLSRIASRNPGIRTVLDVGASYGKWSLVAGPYFTGARYLLVEAQQVHKKRLEKLASKFQNLEYIIAAAGEKPGRIAFDISDPFGGAVAQPGDTAGERTLADVPVVTIDEEVGKRSLQPPFLIKLDTHGHEVPIQRGADKTLEETAVLYIEAYNFRLNDNSLLFHEMCEHMLERGFRVVDICEPLFRPSDGVFWQFDLVFARTESDCFKQESYR